MRDIVERIRVRQRRRHRRDASFGAPRAAHVADGLFVYLDVVAGPRYLAGQGFKEYRYNPSTGLTFDPSIVSHTCLYLPAYIFSVSCTSPIPIASYLCYNWSYCATTVRDTVGGGTVATPKH